MSEHTVPKERERERDREKVIFMQIENKKETEKYREMGEGWQSMVYLGPKVFMLSG